MESNIVELEHRYQALVNDFQSGAITEATFTAEVDKLQFQDEWGRYWMIGSQTGVWHYYDGQTWHQADPNDAGKLPFMDGEGRYWQKGAKSGDWYYYQSETNEWIKPGQGDPAAPAFGQAAPAQPFTGQAAPGYTQVATTPVAEQQSETDLFQDDEGRYWSVGTKSGQWYFYDDNGWHPAHEFQARTGAQTPPPQPAYQTAAPPYPGQAFASRPFQPQVAPAPGPHISQAYAEPVVDPQMAPHGQPSPQMQSIQPAQAYAATPPMVDKEQQPPPGIDPQSAPPPPNDSSKPGNWYYFDGSQWLQYAAKESPKDPPPNAKAAPDQETNPVKSKPKDEPVVAEYIEDDDPPIEVVDVEVITVIEAEPDLEPDVAPAPQPHREPVAPPPIQTRPRRESASLEASSGPPLNNTHTSTSPMAADEVVPRRTKTSPELPVTRKPASAADTQRVPKRRTTTEPGRPVSTKKRAAHEPTIIIPTGSTTATPAKARAKRASRAVAPVSRQQRARENTMPMEAVPVAKPVPAQVRHRQVTQPIPVVAPTPAKQPATKQPAAARQQPKQKIQPPAAVPVTPSVPETKPADDKKDNGNERYTLGAILRAFPSTLWTGVAGVAVLVIFAVIIIALFMYQDNLFNTSGVAALPSTTPTLIAGPPDSTPTPGPTPTNQPSGPVATPTQAAMVTYSSSDLDFTLDHPENWQIAEDSLQTMFSPSVGVLDPDEFKDAGMLIGKSEEEDASISDMLTDVLARFPQDAETLNEGTISIGSQTWTSTQIRFKDDNFKGEAIATLAVTSKDSDGYYLIAVSPAADWNSVQPVFQGMINSFRFGAEKIIAQTTPTKSAKSTSNATKEADSEDAPAEEDDEESKTGSAAKETPAPTRTPKATPAPKITVTPLVYTIKSGDTLLAIAGKFGVDMDLLASENGIDNPESLSLGQELIIPFTAEELAEYNGSGTVATASKSTTADTENTEDTEDATADDTGTNADDEAEETTATSAPAEPAEEATEASPVSGRIVYPAFNNGSGVYDVWMVDLATGEQTPIAGGASQPAFNKDGSLLAYRSWDRGTRGIFFRDFIGGRGDIVTRFVEDALPAWSPDGYSFVFSSRKEGDRVPRIYIGNQVGDEPFAVGFQGEYPSVMTDGRLLVKGCLPTGDCGLFIMGPRGGGEKKISDDASDTSPTSSPDGNKIAFMSYGRAGNNWEIWVMNADGTNPQRLTENNNADGLPAWSPDGQSIAFVSNRGGVWAAWVMNVDGSNQRKLFNMKGPPDGNILHDEFNSRGWLEERISWAP